MNYDIVTFREVISKTSRRSCAAAGSALLATMLGACSTLPDGGYLDSRLAGPCERVAVAWPMSFAALERLINEPLRPHIQNGKGRIQMAVARCGSMPHSARDLAPLLFATISVPAAADSVPIAITSISPDNWSAVSSVIVDTSSHAVFYEFGFQVSDAVIIFDVTQRGNDVSIDIDLQFDAGRIAIKARAIGEPAAHEIADAIIAVGGEHTAAYFGKETSQRYSLTDTTIEFEGSTPLSTSNLSIKPTVAQFDTELIPDRTYWGVPQSQR